MPNSIKQICNYNDCTGCCACFNICAKQAIAMVEDSFGEIHPQIDENKCVGCKMCQQICPINEPVEKNTPKYCFAAWSENIAFREKCASGGIASLLSKYVVEQGGVVYGAQYDNCFNVKTVRASTLEELETFKGSKYTHCFVGNSFKKLQNDLQNGLLCLYISTPCQVAGLRKYLKKKYDNLITADLICHGVSPNSYLKQEIELIKKENHISKIDNVVFRCNSSKNFHLTFWEKGKLLFDKIWIHSFYFRGFLQGITLRENCYSCRFAEGLRVGDFTFGDFIGIADLVSENEKQKVKNSSCVLINTEQGVKYWNLINQIYPIAYIEKTLSDAIKKSPSLKGAYPRHPLRNKFKYLFSKYSYNGAIRKLLGWRIYLHKSPISYFYRIPNKIIKKIRAK